MLSDIYRTDQGNANVPEFVAEIFLLGLKFNIC